MGRGASSGLDLGLAMLNLALPRSQIPRSRLNHPLKVKAKALILELDTHQKKLDVKACQTEKDHGLCDCLTLLARIIL